MKTENLSTLKINKLTDKQYKREYEAGNIKANELYLTPDNTEQEIQNLQDNIDLLDEKINTLSSGGLTREIVSTLPDILEANEQTIYMVGPKDDNTYDEYMYVASKDDYELIGNTNVDLSNYLHTDEDGYVTKDIKVGDSTSSSTLGRASLNLWNSGQ